MKTETVFIDYLGQYASFSRSEAIFELSSRDELAAETEAGKRQMGYVDAFGAIGVVVLCF